MRGIHIFMTFTPPIVATLVGLGLIRELLKIEEMFLQYPILSWVLISAFSVGVLMIIVGMVVSARKQYDRVVRRIW